MVALSFSSGADQNHQTARIRDCRLILKTPSSDQSLVKPRRGDLPFDSRRQDSSYDMRYL